MNSSRAISAISTAILAGGLALLATGCGKTALVAVGSATQFAAPGHFTVPPKVDILLAENNTGKMTAAYPVISQQMPQFLTTLQTQGWDYHFATIPLSIDPSLPVPLTQVMASQYDSNWGSQWLVPFPGAAPGAPGTINPTFFTLPQNYTSFMNVQSFLDSQPQNGQETGFETISRAFSASLGTSNFLRSDALLVILVAGIGNDTSGVTFCALPDNQLVPCEEVDPALGTEQSSFNHYLSAFQALKQHSSQVQFYAAVAAEFSSSCVGGSSYTGTRYMNMASSLNGQSYDLCSVPVSTVLSGIASNLSAVKGDYHTHYLFISQDADPTSIVVTKNPGGDPTQAVTVPQGSSNGWTYAGYVSNVYTIDYPYPMDQASGYAIELNGSAELVGDDTASVSFKPAGTQNSN
jgi:hypothetical protein